MISCLIVCLEAGLLSIGAALMARSLSNFLGRIFVLWVPVVIAREVSNTMKIVIVLAALALVSAGVFAQPSGNNPAGGSMPSMNGSGGSMGKGGMHKGAGGHPHIHRA